MQNIIGEKQESTDKNRTDHRTKTAERKTTVPNVGYECKCNTY